MSRLLFATDFHGAREAYEELLREAAARGVDRVVLGGDLLPPPARSGDRVAPQRAFVDEQLAPLLARARERRPGLRVLGVPGNDDWAAAWERLERLETFVPLHGRAVALDEDDPCDGPAIAGLGLVPITPFAISDFDRTDRPGWRPGREPPRVLLSGSGPSGESVVREATLAELQARPTIEDELRALAARSDPARTVYVVHTPPARTNLDLMEGRVSIGSEALRTFIEAHRPPLTLHGHVHESPRLSGRVDDRLGPTVCLNPGPSHRGLRALQVDVDDPGLLERVGTGWR